MFHITVGVAPPRGADDLGAETALVHAALLYGDAVTVCSPGLVLLDRLAALEQHAETVCQRLAVLASVAGDLGMTDAVERLAQRLVREGEASDEVREIVDVLWDVFSRALGGAVERSGLRAYDGLRQSGRLVLAPLGLDGLVPADYAASAATAYAAHVLDAVTAGATYPLLDAATGEGVRQSAPAVAELRRRRACQPALAARLFGRLPLFDRATTDEVLDVRRDLDAHLARFRSALADYALEVAAAPWDPGFPEEAEAVYVREVAPAVDDIEDAIRSSGPLRALVTRYADRPQLFAPLAAPALAVAVVGPGAVVETVTLALGGTSVVANAAAAWWTHREARREVHQNRLFFYYEARRAFSP